jgi:hypothetical protein
MGKKINHKIFLKLGGASSALVLSVGVVYGLTITSGKVQYLDYAHATHSLSYGRDDKHNWITPIKSQ